MAGEEIVVQTADVPVIVQFTKQGIEGPTGPVGPKGDNAISWEIEMIMNGCPDGRCTMRLYKDGELASDEIHYADIMYLAYGATDFTASSLSRNISGEYQFDYVNVRAIKSVIYEDSSKEIVLCTNSVNYGKSATITIGDVTNVEQGSEYVTNTGNQFDAEFNFGLPRGKAATISVGTTTTLPAGSQATVTQRGTTADRIFDFGIPNGGGSGARVEQTNLILDAGAIFTPSVSNEGVISWTNNASLDNPTSVNIKGPQGIQGVIGPAGEIAIGTVTALDTGQNAYVENVGTSTNAILNFGLPRGAQGIPGEPGTAVPFSGITGNVSDNTQLVTEFGKYVKKTGDLMTGDLSIAKASESGIFLNNNSVTTGTAPSNLTWIGGLTFKDSANNSMGYIANYYDTSKNSVTRIIARQKIDGENIDNKIDLTVAADGTRSVAVSDALEWRTALGLGSAATESTVPISKGGTGATTAADAWTALGGGAIGKKASLAASDIPNISTDKLTSGTLDIARGGTGATTRLNALKALTNENVGADATYFLTITSSWGKGGYTSVANAKTVLGLGGIQARPNYSISTTDLTAGTSSLTTDALYFVYS